MGRSPKKGLTMRKHRRQSALYGKILREAIFDNQDAIYEALVLHDVDCLASDFATFLLDEIGLTSQGFIDYYEREVLNG